MIEEGQRKAEHKKIRNGIQYRAPSINCKIVQTVGRHETVEAPAVLNGLAAENQCKKDTKSTRHNVGHGDIDEYAEKLRGDDPKVKEQYRKLNECEGGHGREGHHKDGLGIFCFEYPYQLDILNVPADSELGCCSPLASSNLSWHRIPTYPILQISWKSRIAAMPICRGNPPLTAFQRC